MGDDGMMAHKSVKYVKAGIKAKVPLGPDRVDLVQVHIDTATVECCRRSSTIDVFAFFSNGDLPFVSLFP
jgi:hypothetical protein